MWRVSGIKIEGTRAQYFFWGTDKEISEKRNFFVNRSVTENFQRKNFSGQVPVESLRTQASDYQYERGVKKFLTVFWSSIVL